VIKLLKTTYHGLRSFWTVLFSILYNWSSNPCVMRKPQRLPPNTSFVRRDVLIIVWVKNTSQEYAPIHWLHVREKLLCDSAKQSRYLICIVFDAKDNIIISIRLSFAIYGWSVLFQLMQKVNWKSWQRIVSQHARWSQELHRKLKHVVNETLQEYGQCLRSFNI